MRPYRRLCVQLTQRDREKIHDLLGGGIQPTRVVLRAVALTQLHDGKTVSEVAANVRLASKTVHDIGLFSRQCLGKRRIPDLPTLRSESRAWNRRTNRAGMLINRKFDRKAAREKFGYTNN